MVIGFERLQAPPPGAGPDVALVLLLHPVDDRVPVADAERVSGAGDDPLDEVLIGLGLGRLRAGLVGGVAGPALGALIRPRRGMEDDDVADRRVGEVVDEAVDQDPLADVEGRLHRLGGDLVGLDDEGLDAERQPEREQDDHDKLDEPAEPGLRLGDRRGQSESSSDSASVSSSPPASVSAFRRPCLGLRRLRFGLGPASASPPRPQGRSPRPRPRRLASGSSTGTTSSCPTPSESSASLSPPLGAAITSSSMPQRRSATRAALPTRPRR